MKHLLTIFIDGLGFDMLHKMPFLSSLPYKEKLQSEIGYSETCHASMYLGVPPEKHEKALIWQYDKSKSPYKILHHLLLDRIDLGIYYKYALYRFARIIARPTSWFGMPFMRNLPLKHWHRLKLTDTKLWTESNYHPDLQTIFDLLNNSGATYQIVTIDNIKGGEESKIIQHTTFDKRFNLIYLFLGDIDAYSHKYGKASKTTVAKLRKVDAILQQKVAEINNLYQCEVPLICWSDHGHSDVIEYLDIYSKFKESHISIQDYPHITDATFFRLWSQDKKALEKISSLFSDWGGFGTILTNDILTKHRASRSNQIWGDFSFSLFPGYAFKETSFGTSRHRSFHGYLPEFKETNGVLLSNNPVQENRNYFLMDIAPSILSVLGLKQPESYQGRSIWIA